jgi:hypothetical protein
VTVFASKIAALNNAVDPMPDLIARKLKTMIGWKSRLPIEPFDACRTSGGTRLSAA